MPTQPLRKPFLLALVLPALFWASEATAQSASHLAPHSSERCITPSVAIGSNPTGEASGNELFDLLLSGRHFFSCPATPEDGHGEGATGPRSGQREDSWPDGQEAIPFLRMNGLGAQRCWECHNSAGVYYKPVVGQTSNPPGPWVAIKPGGIGGASGYSNTLLANRDWPLPQPPDNKLFNIVRSPPAVFGTGYVQRLAFEMTSELLDIRAETIEQAKSSPTRTASMSLQAKGVDFGTLTIECDDPACSDYRQSGVRGVSEDLIVRPLLHKGVTSTVRHFVMSALDFHFSMQAVEVVGANNDCDKDGLFNEMAVDLSYQPGDDAQVLASDAVLQSVASVTALTAWAGMVRPPQFQPSDPTAAAGKKLFASVGCNTCHVESLTIESPLFTIQNPMIEIGTEETCFDNASETNIPSLGSGTVRDPSMHPVLVEHRADKHPSGCPKQDFYCIELSNQASDPLFFSTEFPDIFGTFLPRLPHEPDGSVKVPLYSDLRRWRMGSQLNQVGMEQTDDSNNIIQNDEWLTTKLWGVADSGPWLHDGRARTLKEAILLHQGENSDANDVIATFIALSDADQASIVSFLQSLRLPANPPVNTTIPVIEDGQITDLVRVTTVGTKILRLRAPTASSPRTQSRLKFRSRDSAITIPEKGDNGDPTLHGATLSVYNAQGSTAQVTKTLPKEQWSWNGSEYRFTGNANDPVQRVELRDGRLSIRAGGANWDYNLDAAEQGQVALSLLLQNTEFCASTPARATRRSSNKYDRVGFFESARNSPPPTNCPIAPSGF